MWRFFYTLFHTISGVSRWAQRRFTRAGMLALCALVLSAVFGVDTSLTVAYQLFTLLLALLAIALVLAWFGRTPLVVQAHLPLTLTAGEPFALRFTVRNTSNAALDGVALRAELADPRPPFAAFRARLRFPTYRGWVHLTGTNRIADLDEAAVPPLAAHGVAEIEARGRALRRGRLRITGIDTARTEALGLMRRLLPAVGAAGAEGTAGAAGAVTGTGAADAVGAADICVLPKRYRLPMLSLPGARRHQPGGLPQGSSVGDSEEFLGLRDYRPGDSLQRIHWRSFARAGKPVVKEYQDEFVARHALVLDTFGAAGDEAIFEEAVAVAASFAWTIDTQECLLDLVFAGTEIHTFTSGHGHLMPGRLLEVLAGVAISTGADPATGLGTLARAVCARREQLSGCVCILLHWDEARRALLDALRAGGATVLPLLIAAAAPDPLPAGIKVLHPGRIAQDLAAL